MKKINEIPLVGPAGRRALLKRIEDLEKRVKKLEQESSTDVEEPATEEEEQPFFAILVGTSGDNAECYIKSTDVYKFVDTVDGNILAYADLDCTASAADGEYDFDGTELEQNYEGLVFPNIVGFSVSEGVIDGYLAAVSDEPEEEE